MTLAMELNVLLLERGCRLKSGNGCYVLTGGACGIFRTLQQVYDFLRRIDQ